MLGRLAPQGGTLRRRGPWAHAFVLERHGSASRPIDQEVNRR